MRVSPLVLLLLAGCAASPQEIRQRVHSAGDYQLCEGVITAPPNFMAFIDEEIHSRGLDCRQYSQRIRDRMQAESNRRAVAAQETAATIQLMQAINPTVQPMRPPVNCTSVRAGNSVQTSCY